MKLDLILQTKIGREDILKKFLKLIRRSGKIQYPCSVRLHGVDREDYEKRFMDKASALQIDSCWTEPDLKLSNFKLFATDMDSTLLDLETLDEMAAFIGKGCEVSKITALTMQGKIRNYAESLTARVKLMAGSDASIVDRLIKSHIKPNPGAESLLAALKSAGIPTILVSGGFSCITNVVKERFGFTHVISNELEIVDGKLTGRVTGPYGTPIIDGRGKISYVSAYALQHGIDLSDLITMGDGSNDIPMLEAAGMSVAWHAKPKVRPFAKQAFDFAPLSGLLSLFVDGQKYVPKAKLKAAMQSNAKSIETTKTKAKSKPAPRRKEAALPAATATA